MCLFLVQCSVTAIPLLRGAAGRGTWLPVDVKPRTPRVNILFTVIHWGWMYADFGLRSCSLPAIGPVSPPHQQQPHSRNLQTSVSPPPAKLAPNVPQLRAHGAVRPCVGAPPDGLGNWLSWFSLGISSSPALSAAVKAAPVCSGLPAHNLPPARIGRSRSSQQTSQRAHAVPVLPRPWWVAWYS